VLDISGPGVTRSSIDVPYDHSMGAADWQKRFAGFPTATEMSFSLNLDPGAAIHVGGAGTGIYGSFNDTYNGTSLPAFNYYNPAMTGGTITITFDGFVSTFTPNIGMVQGVMAAEVAIMPSGAWTITVT